MKDVTAKASLQKQHFSNIGSAKEHLRDSLWSHRGEAVENALNFGYDYNTYNDKSLKLGCQIKGERLGTGMK